MVHCLKRILRSLPWNGSNCMLKEILHTHTLLYVYHMFFKELMEYHTLWIYIYTWEGGNKSQHPIYPYVPQYISPKDSSPRNPSCTYFSPIYFSPRESSPRNSSCTYFSPFSSRDSSPRNSYCTDFSPRNSSCTYFSPIYFSPRDSSPRNSSCTYFSPTYFHP